MPNLVSPEIAAEEISAGLKSLAFEITFPKSFTYKLKLLQFLPYGLYFKVINRFTGWSEKPKSSHQAAPHPAE
jgi:hypothetical protein